MRRLPLAALPGAKRLKSFTNEFGCIYYFRVHYFFKLMVRYPNHKQAKEKKWKN